MKLDERLCPQCAEPIKKAAAKCKHCSSAVTPENVKDSIGGCIGLLVLLAIIFALFRACSGPDKTPEQIAAEVKASAEDRRKGFHCLSAWDGSNRSLIDQVKAGLRDPKSFEHVETRIGPVNDNGNHLITMKYRAQNGFGGMNVGTAIGSVSQSNCEASLSLSGDD